MEESFPEVDLQKVSEQVECNKLREACEKWGCFRIINHPIPVTLMEDMKVVARSLIDLPLDIKKRCTLGKFYSGYVPPHATNPLFEALGLYDLSSSQDVQDFCSKLDASPHQRKTRALKRSHEICYDVYLHMHTYDWVVMAIRLQIIEAYGKAIHHLAMSIGQKIAESLGIVGADFNDWPLHLRINKYHFTPESVGSSGLQLHSDSAFLTILQDDENVGGLEMMNNSGSFVALPHKSGTLLANLGDVGHAWSNGRFCNVKHRVQCKEATTRLSIATFMFPPREGNVEAPTELVDPDHPRLYLPFTFEDYWKLQFSKNMYAGQALELLRMG